MTIFSATVIRGEGRGRQLGFPTANLDIKLELEEGVYLVEAEIKNKKYNGLMHYGRKKTFNSIFSAEIFIDNFREDIYGEKIKVKILKKIREVKKFRKPEELAEQIKKDKIYLNV